MFFVKALPISEEYFDELAARSNVPAKFDDLADIPDDDMKMIFNFLNKIVLFTVFSLRCEIDSEKLF